MAFTGKIVCGSADVLIENLPAARVSDTTDHGGVIQTGCSTVLINGTGLLAARETDRFTCPEATLTIPHTGGVITTGCSTVLIGGLPAARESDPTVCLGPAFGSGGGGGGSGGAAGTPSTSPCAAIWDKLDKAAQAVIAPVDHDDRLRNKAISAAYADLCLKNPIFQWAGLAAYASKQVGCAMDHCDYITRSAPWLAPGLGAPGAAALGGSAQWLKRQLGRGNRNLFLDIYPMHLFFQLYGFTRLKQCASERRPPMTGQALDGFKALDDYKRTGDPKYLRQSVRSLALHEQIWVLQREIYANKGMQTLLDSNELGLPLSKPADVVMEAGCTDSTGGKRTHPFGKKGRSHVWDVNERMDWILNDIVPDYDRFVGSPRHKADLSTIRAQGVSAGAALPP